MQSFERGRITGISGMESVLTLNPANMGPRIKKSVIRMLEEAHITGGWNSQSRKVAELLAEKFKLNMLQTRWNGVTLFAQPQPEHVEEIIELLKADMALFVMENPNYARSWYTRQCDETIAQLREGTAKFVDFRNGIYSKKAIELINMHLSPEYVAKSKRVIDMLVNNTPISITTIRS
jgi:hypothetical protein